MRLPTLDAGREKPQFDDQSPVCCMQEKHRPDLPNDSSSTPSKIAFSFQLDPRGSCVRARIQD